MTGKTTPDRNSPFGTYSTGPFSKWLWRICDFSGFGPVIRRKLRKHIARRFSGPFDIVHEQLKFRLYPGENYCDRVMFGRGKLPEEAEHRALDSIVEPGMVFVDIGANIGSYSVYVAGLVKQDFTLVAFEPHPKTFAKLMFNLQANGVATDQVRNCGVGDEAGELDLWSDGGSNIGHTSMLKSGTSNPKVSVKVPVVPLLEVLNEAGIDRIDLLKIDIEGFEDRALSPFITSAADGLLPKHILIETAHSQLWQSDLFGHLRERGYELVFETAENQIYRKGKAVA